MVQQVTMATPGGLPAVMAACACSPATPGTEALAAANWREQAANESDKRFHLLGGQTEAPL